MAPRARPCGGPRMRAGPSEAGGGWGDGVVWGSGAGAGAAAASSPPTGSGGKKGCKYAPTVRLARFPGEHRLCCQKHLPLAAFMLASSVSAVVWECPLRRVGSKI